MTVGVVLVAAGRGSRAGPGSPKQYRDLAGRPVLAWALEPFLRSPEIARVVCVIHADDRAAYDAATRDLPGDKLLPPSLGGATRQDSVRAGLDALAGEACAHVLVHDAARPFVRPALIARAIEAARRFGAAVPGVPLTDTLVAVEADAVVATPPRTGFRAVQTPQAFRFDLVAACHARAAREGRHDFTDDGGLVRAYGHPVHVFPGEGANLKMTEAGDIEAAALRLGDTRLVARSATGFDVHAFGPGDHVRLCGLAVPFERGLVGHSDADVALHALTDALLGTIGDGDIGVHFPPSDPAWKGAASDRFVRHAVERVAARGGIVDFVDLTLICEAPKIGPHREAMRARLAAICGLSPDQVSVKATTTEGLGFTGRREGIAALATATVRLPRP